MANDRRNATNAQRMAQACAATLLLGAATSAAQTRPFTPARAAPIAPVVVVPVAPRPAPIAPAARVTITPIAPIAPPAPVTVTQVAPIAPPPVLTSPSAPPQIGASGTRTIVIPNLTPRTVAGVAARAAAEQQQQFNAYQLQYLATLPYLTSPAVTPPMSAPSGAPAANAQTPFGSANGPPSGAPTFDSTNVPGGVQPRVSYFSDSTTPGGSWSTNDQPSVSYYSNSADRYPGAAPRGTFTEATETTEAQGSPSPAAAPTTSVAPTAPAASVAPAALETPASAPQGEPSANAAPMSPPSGAETQKNQGATPAAAPAAPIEAPNTATNGATGAASSEVAATDTTGAEPEQPPSNPDQSGLASASTEASHEFAPRRLPASPPGVTGLQSVSATLEKVAVVALLGLVSFFCAVAAVVGVALGLRGLPKRAPEH